MSVPRSMGYPAALARTCDCSTCCRTRKLRGAELRASSRARGASMQAVRHACAGRGEHLAPQWDRPCQMPVRVRRPAYVHISDSSFDRRGVLLVSSAASIFAVRQEVVIDANYPAHKPAIRRTQKYRDIAIEGSHATSVNRRPTS